MDQIKTKTHHIHFSKETGENVWHAIIWALISMGLHHRGSTPWSMLCRLRWQHYLGYFIYVVDVMLRPNQIIFEARYCLTSPQDEFICRITKIKKIYIYIFNWCVEFLCFKSCIERLSRSELRGDSLQVCHKEWPGPSLCLLSFSLAFDSQWKASVFLLEIKPPPVFEKPSGSLLMFSGRLPNPQRLSWLSRRLRAAGNLSFTEMDAHHWDLNLKRVLSHAKHKLLLAAAVWTLCVLNATVKTIVKFRFKAELVWDEIIIRRLTVLMQCVTEQCFSPQEANY